jgi:hypothetical protein
VLVGLVVRGVRLAIAHLHAHGSSEDAAQYRDRDALNVQIPDALSIFDCHEEICLGGAAAIQTVEGVKGGSE